VDLFGDDFAFRFEAEESFWIVFHSEVSGSGSGAGFGSGVLAPSVTLSVLLGLAVVGVTVFLASRSF
jgi:hypothetical protein